MKAAFKPPPKKADSITAEFLPSFTSLPSVTENSESGANPLLVTPSGPNGGSPINPSLLNPLDSTSAAAVQSTLLPGGKEDQAPPAPPTPAQQAPQWSPNSSLSPASEVRGPRRDGSRTPVDGASTPKTGTSQRSGRVSFDRRSGRATPKSGQENLNSLDDLEKIEGQDSLEVRTVALANGQVASLILEEGRLQRIVSSNGQIAELSWQPPPEPRGPQGGRRSRQLSVKMHRGVSPPRKSQSNVSMVMPASLKRWANSLNSQRITTGALHSDYSSDLATSPARQGAKSQSNKEMRKIRSIDMSRPGKDGKRKGFVQSLFTLPTHKHTESPDATQDMQTILETNREVKGEWNPMGSTWLPSHMTTLESAEMPAESTAQQDRRRRTRSVDTGLLANRPASLYTGSNQLPAISSPPETPVGPPPPPPHSGLKVKPAPVEGQPEKGKKGMWSTFKKALHIPKIGRSATPRSQATPPHTPGSHTPGSHTPGSQDPGTPGSAKKTKSKSASKRFATRFSIGAGKRGKEASADMLPEGEDGSASKSRSTSAIDASLAPAAANRSRSTSDFASRGIGMDITRLADSLEESDAAEQDAAASRQQEAAQSSSSGLAGSSDLRASRIEEEAELDLDRGSSMDFRAPKSAFPQYSEGWLGRPEGEQAAPREQPQDAALQQQPTKSYGLTTGGSLVDTTELKAALSNRKSSSLQSQTQDYGSATPKSGSGRKYSDLSGSKQRTLMAGKWQKNFTEGTSGSKVDDLLHVSSLQRLARERIVEMQIVETEDTFELVWHIPLNGSASKISKTDRYLKNGEVVEAARRDGRPGLLRSQLTFTPEGHVHIRALQGEPYSAVFHDRIKLSSGGRRIKFEQKFQLLQPGVAPVKYYSIWHRIE